MLAQYRCTIYTDFIIDFKIQSNLNLGIDLNDYVEQYS